MSRKTFQQYGELARTELSNSVTSGRYRVRSESEAYMIRDIFTKLDLQPTDHFLEIGCGAGNLLIPLSFMTAVATGIDHPQVIERLGKRYRDSDLKLVGSNFLDYAPASDEFYEKILINSVLEALTDEPEAFNFIEKAARLLAPGGRLLIGDIANVDKKRRFIETKYGQAFDREWQDSITTTGDAGAQEEVAANILLKDDEMLVQTDEFILQLVRRYRRPGWGAYCLPQPVNLPFGHTREDVLITRLFE